MKKYLQTILLFCLAIFSLSLLVYEVSASWTMNPFTGELDYYETSSATGTMTALPHTQIYVGNSSNEATATSAITVLNTGDVGIGTDAPVGRIHVVGDDATKKGALGFAASDKQNSSSIYVQGDGFGYFIAADTTNDIEFTSGVSTLGEGMVNTATLHALDIRTNNISRIHILPAGNVGIGTKTPAHKLEVDGNVYFDGTLKIGAYTLPSTDGTNGYVLKTDGSGSLSWQADTSGGAGGGSGLWATTSDSLLVYPVDVSDTVVIGGNATTSAGHIFEVIGDSEFDTANFSGAITASNLNVSNWDTAFGWGDHDGIYDVLGQATSTLASHTSTYNHNNYNTAYGWGNHLGLYDILGQATSTLASHTNTYNHANYDTAFGWGNHSGLYDILGQATSTLASHTATYNHANYDTAYGWGDWNGNIDISTDTNLTVGATGIELDGDDIALTANYIIPLSASTTNWETAYSWGDHSSGGYVSDGCSDCLNATEIEDIYLLNSGDIMTGKLELTGNGMIVASGNGGGESEPNGAGTRLVWCPTEASFRAGMITGTEWDATNIGSYSTAFGHNTTSSGINSFVAGRDNIASGISSFAMSQNNTASGNYSTALNYDNIASGNFSSAFGREIQAGADYVFAIALNDQNGTNCNQANSMCIMGGKIGIGTTSPAELLTVAGNGYIDGTLKVGAYTLPSTDGTNGYVLKTDGSGALTWQEDTSGSGGGSSIWSTSTLLYYYNGANSIVIGNTATTSDVKFEVNGDSAFDTIKAGTWNGTAITDAYISNTLTVDGYMQDTDIDTFSELNAWITDATIASTTHIWDFSDYTNATGGTGITLNDDAIDWSSSGLSWAGNAITNAYIASSTEFLVDNDTTYVSSDWTLSDITGYVAGEHFLQSAITETGTIGTGVWQATDIGVAYGGTGVSTLTDHGVLIGSGATAITALTVGTDGQILIGSTGADPVFADLTCGDNITCTTGAGTLEIDVDDAFVLHAGDVYTGVHDIGGATSLEIPNATNPTVDATGEVAINTTAASSSFRYYDGTAERALFDVEEKCFTMASSTFDNYDNIPLWNAERAFTITSMTCRANGGTSLVATLSDGTNNLDALTCAITKTNDDGTIANASFTIGEQLEVDFGTNTGEVDFINYCISFRYSAD